MRTFSIGREGGCDIIINDPTDVISRRHAILTVGSFGKITITDQSHNGTYVNGMRISSNVPVPITRKDNISFAHIARLDWRQIPDPMLKYKYGLSGLMGAFVFAFLIWLGISNKEDQPNPVDESSEVIRERDRSAGMIKSGEKEVEPKEKDDPQKGILEPRENGGASKTRKPTSETGKKKKGETPNEQKKETTKRIR